MKYTRDYNKILIVILLMGHIIIVLMRPYYNTNKRAYKYNTNGECTISPYYNTNITTHAFATLVYSLRSHVHFVLLLCNE